MNHDRGLDTRAIHAGEPRPTDQGSVVAPIYQSATFEGRPGETDFRYGRYSNTPTHDLLHGKLASLEGAEAALVTSSGMSAISSTLLSLLSAGDHLLVQGGLYGGTHALVHRELPRLGIEVTEVSGGDASAWAKALRPSTRAFHLEAISNPLLRVSDLRAAVAFAREHQLLTTIDSTFATPVNLRPLELGIDLVVHSATKYLNGHSDVVAGAVMGSRERVRAVEGVVRLHGGSLDPNSCFLLSRGIRTLGVRVRRHNESGLAVARGLCELPGVTVVHHPGLEVHPDHQRARELFEGFGGMLSFEVAAEVSVDRFLERLELFTVAPSLGGVESLACLPARTSHAALSPEERARVGIGDGLVRLSVGLEDPSDLLEDLESALLASSRVS